jgi:hypothetical protein
MPANPTLFYSWQSDRPTNTNKFLVRSCVIAALDRIATDCKISDAPRIDHDTFGESGSPAIAETIYEKIRRCAVFLADVTFIGDVRDDDGRVKKRVSNPNVLIELGYAAATVGWERVVLVMNTKYGDPSRLPFDLRNRRFPVTYELGPESEKRVNSALVEEFRFQIQTCLDSEYGMVNKALLQLNAVARRLMQRMADSQGFWEQPVDEGKVPTVQNFKHILAIEKLFQLGLIECASVANAPEQIGYQWTYLGRQCVAHLRAKEE